MSSKNPTSNNKKFTIVNRKPKPHTTPNGNVQVYSDGAETKPSYKADLKRLDNVTNKYYVTSCGEVVGDNNDSITYSKAEERLALYKKRGYKELLIVEASDHVVTKANDNTLEENITYSRVYLPRKFDKQNIDYINMVKFSESSIGVKLSLGYGLDLTTNLFGEIGSVRNFLDYITNPKYPLSLLKKKKISSEMRASIPKAKGRVLPNYWAIVCSVMIERVKNDKALMDELLSLPKSVKFTMFKVKQTKDVLDNDVNIVTPMSEYVRYCNIVNDIFQAIKHHPKALTNTKTIAEIMTRNTAFKDKYIYEGLEFIRR